MKTHSINLKLGVLAVAVSTALASVAASAEDDDVKAATTPQSSIEFGISNTSRDSSKFGEYNGLDKSGAGVVGGFDIRGGDAYGGQGGRTRWSLIGTDLGLSNRSLSGNYTEQGRWTVGIKFDQLEHNLSDSYQTPYVGGLGSNSFSLPTGFGTTANTTTMNATQLGALHNLDISSTRKNSSFLAGLNLNSQWDIKLDFNHLEQSGAKLMGFGLSPLTLGGAGGQNVSVLPMPTNSQTDTVNLAVNWLGEKAHVTGSYFGSYFHNDYDRVTFQSWNQAGQFNTMSTAPGNLFHQLSLSGGYALTNKTRVAGNLSYAINTQDQAFAYDPFLMRPGSPLVASANAKVFTTHADIKLSDQSFKDLALSAGLKYDERDNRTPSNIYNFMAIDGNAGNVANYPNTPQSLRKTQLELAGDYRIKIAQYLRLAYTREDISRWCNNYAVNAGYPAGTNCVVAKASQEDKLDATYRVSAFDSVNFRFGYGYSSRRLDADPYARAAFIGTNGSINGVSAPGQNAGDWNGFHPYMDASRIQNMFKGNADWTVSDTLSLAAGVRITDDNYNTSLGMQSGKTWSINLDANYRYSENGTLTSFITQQNRNRSMTDRQNATALWTDKLTDEDITVGLGAKHTGMIGGKLDMSGDATHSWASTGYNTQILSGPLVATCATPAVLSCGEVPAIKTAITQLKLTGTYKVDKQTKVALRYIYQHMNGEDYYYNGYQTGFTPTQVMPTNQQVGNHTVSFASVSYIYSF